MTAQEQYDLTPHDEAILAELYNLYSAFAEIKGPANTWGEVNALHDELCALDGGNLLPGIAEKDAERLSPAGRLCALILLPVGALDTADPPLRRGAQSHRFQRPASCFS